MSSVPPAPLADDLLAAWTLLLESGNSDWTDVPAGMAQRVYAIELADDDVVREVRHDFNEAVNALNDLCALVDEGLVRPKDVVRAHPEQHERLLTVLHLLEPFIWYESILRGRGRWGFRVAQLRRVMEALRPVSSRHVLLSEHLLGAGGLVLMALPEVRPITRAWRLVLLAIRSPTISVHSKLRQTRYRDSLARELSELGVATLRTSDEKRGAVDW